MSLDVHAGRRWANEHAAVIIVVVLGVAAVSLGAISFNLRCCPPDEWAWYVVEGTQKFVVDRADLLPPIERDGKVLVRAHLYGCGDCTDANRFVGYYEKFTDEAKAAIERLTRTVPPGAHMDDDTEILIYDLALKGHLVSFDGKTWLPRDSAEAEGIFEQMAARCGGRKLVYCGP